MWPFVGLSVENLINIISVVVVWVGAIIAWRKAPGEAKKTDAEAQHEDAQAAESYATATRMYAEEVQKLRIELDAVRSKNEKNKALIVEQARKIAELDELKVELAKREELINTLNMALAEMRVYAEEMTAKNETVEDWANRLFHQVKSLGGEPVPLKIPSKKGST